jgi:hypothetical protein
MLHLADTLFSYEAGELDEVETVELFQELIDTGLVWSLQGHYGRTAAALLDQRVLTLPDAALRR